MDLLVWITISCRDVRRMSQARDHTLESILNTLVWKLAIIKVLSSLSWTSKVWKIVVSDKRSWNLLRSKSTLQTGVEKLEGKQPRWDQVKYKVRQRKQATCRPTLTSILLQTIWTNSILSWIIVGLSPIVVKTGFMVMKTMMTTTMTSLIEPTRTIWTIATTLQIFWSTI